LYSIVFFMVSIKSLASWLQLGLWLPCLPSASGKGFLHDEHSSFTVQMLDRDLQTAMQEVMGCGSRKASPDALARIERAVQPMWNTMPTNSYGNL